MFGSAPTTIAAMLALTDRRMGRQQLNRSYWAQLVRKVARRTRRPDDAEDLLHSAYERLARHRTTHEIDNPTAFLVTAAAHIAIDDYRRNQICPQDDLRYADQHPDQAPLQDEVLAARARLERVRDGLANLSPRTREIFLMHRLDGLKYREIATQLGLTQSAVEKHIAKAMLFLTEWAEGW